jgi:N-acetylmuramoyl-L-alanine amidase
MKPLVCGIAAGHGGEDGGAVSGDLVESDLNLALANAIVTIPSGPHLVFEMIRLRDDDLPLDVRNSMAKQLGCDFVVELHHNSLSVNQAAHGALIFWYRGSGKAGSLADKIAAAMPKALQPARAVRIGPVTGGDSDDYPRARHVLESYSAPCLVVEVAYLSNVSDREYLRKPTSTAEVAASIHAGLMQAPAVWSIR